MLKEKWSYRAASVGGLLAGVLNYFIYETADGTTLRQAAVLILSTVAAFLIVAAVRNQFVRAKP